MKTVYYYDAEVCAAMNDARLNKLVRAAKIGKQKHITELYNQTKDYAYYVAGHYVPVCDIPDVLQETYIAVFQNLKTFDEARDFKPWLHTIVRNKCMDHIKRMNRLPFSYDDEVEYLADSRSLPDDLLEREQTRKDIQKIIDNLSIGQRTAVTLFYLEGITISEIAQILNISDGTVKKQLYLARRAIREAVLLEESDNDNKLYGAAAVPFLTQMFEKQLEAGEYTMPEQLSEQLLGSIMDSIASSGVIQGVGSFSLLAGGKLLLAAALVACVTSGGIYLYSTQQPRSEGPVPSPPSSYSVNSQQPISATAPSVPNKPASSPVEPAASPQPAYGFTTTYECHLLGTLQIQGFSGPTTPKQIKYDLSLYAKRRRGRLRAAFLRG